MNNNPTEVWYAEEEELPYLNNSPPELAHAAEQAAELACVPTQQRPPFCDWVCCCVQRVWKEPARTVSSKRDRALIDRALIKAAKAAQTLNEAVCSLRKEDRNWLEELVARDPLVSEERRLRGSTKPFETDELQWTVFLLDRLFSTAVGEVPPLMAGVATLRKKRGKKPGTVNNPEFHDFVWSLLSGAADAGGEFTLDKNAEKGTLIDALNILRPHLPRGVIPNALPLGTIQKIKTSHAKYQGLPDRL